MYHKNCMSTYILKFKRHIRTLLDYNEDVTFSSNEQVKRAFLQVVLMLNLQISGYAVSTIRENMDEALREGSGTLLSKYLYIMQIHVNNGYESDGLSLVAMLIYMCFNLSFTFFGIYVEKFCYHTLCCFYEHF